MNAPAPIVDIGTNLTNKRFRRDRDEVIARARAAGVAQLVCTGVTVESSWAGSALARRYPGVVYSTAGVHPHFTRDCDDTTLDELRALAGRDEVVVLGECGLDYDRNFSPPPVQRQWYAAQLGLACELGMPVFLHDRDAHDDFAAIMREHRASLAGGVVHCFTGTGDVLDAYLDMDLHIGITGWICDERRGSHLRDIVKRIPADRLMIETDAPFLLPRDMPNRPKDRRNEPAFLPHVLATVAECVDKPPAQVAEETTATAGRFFGLA